MRSFSVVLAVSSVAVALVGGCSSTFSPPSATSSSKGPAGSSSAAPSSMKQGDDRLPDPAVLLREASATAEDLQSAHLVMSVVGKVAEIPVKALKGDLTNDNGAAAPGDAPASDTKSSEPTTTGEKTESREPDSEDQKNAAAKGSGKVSILGSEIDFHFIVVDGHLFVSLPGAAWVDYGPAARPYSVTTLLSLDEGLANVLANFVDPTVEARETVGDQQTIRVTGRVTPTAVNKFIPQLGATERMPATVWIQESGDRQVVEVSLEPTKGNYVQIVFSDWNKPVTVEKPPV